MNESAPQSISGYQIESVIGSGGMGTVYLARHRALPRYVALKVLDTQAGASASARARFGREARLAAALSHPHIVRVLDASVDGTSVDGTSPGSPADASAPLWIAMQYVPGTDAAAEIGAAGGTGLDPRHVATVITAVASALDHAHRQGMLHRDVKPANILISSEDDRVLLTDFGVARLMDDPVTMSTSNTMFVSLAYAAPERLRGDPSDGRADQYSLAATAFHMLAGAPPFRRETVAAMLMAHLADEVSSVAAIGGSPALAQSADIARVDEVLARGLAKDPAQRYVDCSQFAAALARALGQPYRSAAVPSQPGLDAGEYRQVIPPARPHTRDGVASHTAIPGPAQPRQFASAPSPVTGAAAPPHRLGSARVWRAVFFATLAICIVIVAVVLALG
ncbi:hypothetical protein GCM10027169_10360 [Gordonia jinhuaensis]|uniref:non-specific serine/threonine protein kinase n=1 Tax=Gordonia jinhuaensis TaxID=1517702 RepID=A0A916WNJ6_9ACTN|nr:serine/threonine-protein kinase [Gordonia jinhuaensis]GGB19516.1 hypothetical protein GCM10011489_04520 [Gordonia jinhuaensis]